MGCITSDFFRGIHLTQLIGVGKITTTKYAVDAHDAFKSKDRDAATRRLDMARYRGKSNAITNVDGLRDFLSQVTTEARTEEDTKL